MRVWLTTLVAWLVTGCIQFDLALDLNANGSGVLRQTIALAFDPEPGNVSERPDMKTQPRNLLDQMAEDALKGGGRVEKREKQRLVIAYPFANVEALDLAALLDVPDASRARVVVQRHDFLFWHDKDVRVVLDLGPQVPNPLTMASGMLEEKVLDFRFHMDLPALPKFTNAEVRDGRHLTWQVKANQRLEAQAQYQTVGL